MHDPRDGPTLTARDLLALRFIGLGFEVAQYQLRAAIFQGLSEVVASRRVRRWLRLGLIAIERWNGVGINRIRLTAAGRAAVVAAGLATEDELFVPRQAVQPKDVCHTMWINDLRVVAAEGLPIRADRIEPAWALQRRLAPSSPTLPGPLAIPDLLLVQKARGGKRASIVAMEVDLGGERLASTFVPKLGKLAGLLVEWAGPSARTWIVILTRGPRRLESLRARVLEANVPVPVVAELLPEAAGAEALVALRVLLSRGVQASEQGNRVEVHASV